jgi:hypothetical protein
MASILCQGSAGRQRVGHRVGSFPAFPRACRTQPHFQNVLDFVALHPSLAIVAAFLVSLCEALPIIALFAPIF